MWNFLADLYAQHCEAATLKTNVNEMSTHVWLKLYHTECAHYMHTNVSPNYTLSVDNYCTVLVKVIYKESWHSWRMIYRKQ